MYYVCLRTWIRNSVIVNWENYLFFRLPKCGVLLLTMNSMRSSLILYICCTSGRFFWLFLCEILCVALFCFFSLFDNCNIWLLRFYFRYLLVNPKERRVVVVESILCPTVFRETLAKVLFNHFEVKLTWLLQFIGSDCAGPTFYRSFRTWKEACILLHLAASC